MADSKHTDSTRAELGDLKIHVLALTQAVMGLLRGVAKPPPPQAPQMRQAGSPGGGPPGAGGPPQVPPQLAAMIAAKRQQAMQGAPQQMPQPPPQGMPPGHAIGGLQMGLNRLEPTGAFSRGIAHSLNPTKLNFHSPHPGHFAMGGMQPPMAAPMQRPMMGARPQVNPAMLAMMASKYGVR